MKVIIYNLKYYGKLAFTFDELNEEAKQYILDQVHSHGWKVEDCWSGVFESLEKKFCYDRFEKEIRNKVIEEFVKFEDYLMDKIKEEIVDVNIDYEWRKVVCLDDIGTKLRDGLREIAEQMKETEKPFFNFDSPVVDVDKKVIRRFADWCYINGIDFSYMSTTKKSAKQFIDDVIERYSKEQMKEVGE